MDILIMGIGNVLLSDEGVGVKTVEELERRFSFPEGVELLDGGTAGIELLTYIRNREVVIIIDANVAWCGPIAIIKSVKDVNVNDEVKILVNDGVVNTKVISVREDE